MADVVERRRRGGEVHHHVGVVQRVDQRCLERRVGPAGELQVVGLGNRLADGRPPSGPPHR